MLMADRWLLSYRMIQMQEFTIINRVLVLYNKYGIQLLFA
jgi:hypothetical protein